MPPRRRINAHEKRIVAARQKWTCAYCDTLLAATFEVDHIIPLHCGGRDDYETNCNALCCECHRAKTQREEVERLRAQTLKKRSLLSLSCSRCEAVVSPYFLHRCEEVTPHHRLPTTDENDAGPPPSSRRPRVADPMHVPTPSFSDDDATPCDADAPPRT